MAIVPEAFVYKMSTSTQRGASILICMARSSMSCILAQDEGLRYSRPVYLSTLPCILARISAKVPQRRDQISHAVGR